LLQVPLPATYECVGVIRGGGKPGSCAVHRSASVDSEKIGLFWPVTHVVDHASVPNQQHVFHLNAHGTAPRSLFDRTPPQPQPHTHHVTATNHTHSMPIHWLLQKQTS
jgi:hypothetical protein